MKKTVPLKKELAFKSNLAQIVSIALDQEFKLEESTVKGNLLISGSYKMNDVSVNTEPFSYNIPVNIELSDRYILDNLTIDVDDFYYEIIDNNVLSVNIEIGLDKLEEKEQIEITKEEIKEESIEELANPIKYEEQIVEKVDNMSERNDTIKNDRMDVKEVKTLFDSLDESVDTYSTYKVCIVHESDTIESIVIKYGITRELLEQYNDISDIKIGDKLIIPALFNETN